MNEFHREYVLADGVYGVDLWSNVEETWGEVTLPSEAKIPICFINGEPVSRLIDEYQACGMHADMVAFRTVHENLTAEARDTALRAFNKLHSLN